MVTVTRVIRIEPLPPSNHGPLGLVSHGRRLAPELSTCSIGMRSGGGGGHFVIRVKCVFVYLIKNHFRVSPGLPVNTVYNVQ